MLIICMVSQNAAKEMNIVMKCSTMAFVIGVTQNDEYMGTNVIRSPSVLGLFWRITVFSMSHPWAFKFTY